MTYYWTSFHGELNVRVGPGGLNSTFVQSQLAVRVVALGTINLDSLDWNHRTMLPASSYQRP